MTDAFLFSIAHLSLFIIMLSQLNLQKPSALRNAVVGIVVVVVVADAAVDVVVASDEVVVDNAASLGPDVRMYSSQTCLTIECRCVQSIFELHSYNRG